MVPTFGTSDQRTPGYVAPCTDAVNFADWPAVRVVGPAPIVMLTFETGGAATDTGWLSNTVAVAVLAGSAKLVAEIVTWDSPLSEDGAE